jgi:hypothetical protein
VTLNTVKESKLFSWTSVWLAGNLTEGKKHIERWDCKMGKLTLRKPSRWRILIYLIILSEI